MALRAHRTIPRNLTSEKVFDSHTGILHALLSDALTLTLQYWITTRSILPTFKQDSQDSVYNVLYFNFFSTELVWTRLFSDQPVSNTISVQGNKTDPPTFPSLARSMSTSPTPATPPRHNSLSKPNVDPTTTLIPLMQQTLHQNSIIMAHTNTQLSLMLSPQPPPSQPYKPQPPPFTKWDRTPTTTTLLITQVVMYKAEAF